MSTKAIDSTMLAVADAVYVLKWLMQRHDREHMLLPENILGLSRRALKVLGAEVEELCKDLAENSQRADVGASN